MLPYFCARPCCSTLSFRGAPPGPETGNFPIIHVRVSSGSSTEPRLEARGLCEQRGHTELVDPRSDWLVQAETVSPATSKLYTRAVFAAGDLGLLVARHPGQDLRQDLPGLGKGRLAVRIVRSPHHVVDADDVSQANTDRILLEA